MLILSTLDIIGQINKDVPQILINRELVAKPHEFDVFLEGDCDTHVKELCTRLSWALPTMDTVRINPIVSHRDRDRKRAKIDKSVHADSMGAVETVKETEQEKAGKGKEKEPETTGGQRMNGD